jgi:filamentous hemagglutinin
VTDVPDLAKRIAGGHAYRKHVVDRNEFPDAPNRRRFAALVARVLASPDETKRLKDGRRAYWHDETRTLVMVNPRDPDGGTAFRPIRGRAYFDELEEDG